MKIIVTLIILVALSFADYKEFKEFCQEIEADAMVDIQSYGSLAQAHDGLKIKLESDLASQLAGALVESEWFKNIITKQYNTTQTYSKELISHIKKQSKGWVFAKFKRFEDGLKYKKIDNNTLYAEAQFNCSKRVYRQLKILMRVE